MNESESTQYDLSALRQVTRIACVEQSCQQEWFTYDWSVPPVLCTSIHNSVIGRIVAIATLHKLPLLSRWKYQTMNVSRLQLDELFEELSWVYYATQNVAHQSSVEEIGEVVKTAMIRGHWITVKRFEPPQMKWAVW